MFFLYSTFFFLYTLCLTKSTPLVDAFSSGIIVNNLSEAGEFSIDLYTMPDTLTTKLWEHLVSFNHTFWNSQASDHSSVQEGSCRLKVCASECRRVSCTPEYVGSPGTGR